MPVPIKSLKPKDTFLFPTESLKTFKDCDEVQPSDVFEFCYPSEARRAVEVRRIHDGARWYIRNETLVEQVFSTYLTRQQLDSLKLPVPV